MGLVRITSWYPNFNGSHLGLPPSEIHRMTRLPPKIVWTMTYYSNRPHSFHWNEVGLVYSWPPGRCTLTGLRHFLAVLMRSIIHDVAPVSVAVHVRSMPCWTGSSCVSRLRRRWKIFGLLEHFVTVLNVLSVDLHGQLHSNWYFAAGVVSRSTAVVSTLSASNCKSNFRKPKIDRNLEFNSIIFSSHFFKLWTSSPCIKRATTERNQCAEGEQLQLEKSAVVESRSDTQWPLSKKERVNPR